MPSRQTRVAVLCLGVAAAVPLLHVLLAPTTSLPGSELGDVYKHAWSYWHCLAQGGAWPETSSLNAPAGGRLLDVMLAPALLMAPVTVLLGPVFSANLWVWLSLWAVGLCTFLLARELTDNTPGALVAGVLTIWAPYLAGYPLFSGVHERLAIWVFPWTLICLRHLALGGGWRWGMGLLGAVALVSMSCGVYALWALLLGLAALPVLPRSDGTLRRLAAWSAPAMGLLLAAFGVSRWITDDVRSLSPQPGRLDLSLGIGPQALDTSTLAELLWPPAVHAQQPVDSGDLLFQVTYLGWVVLGTALVGAWRGGVYSRSVRWCVGMGCLAATLSLGPSVDLVGFGIPNPFYRVLAWIVPLFGRIPVPFQWVGVALPLLGVGVASFVATGRKPILVAAVVGILGGVERIAVPPVGLIQPAARAEVSPALGGLEAGNVVEIPRQFQGRFLASGRVFLAQTVHEQPIPVSVHLGVTAWDAYAPVLTGTTTDWPQTLRCFARGGFRWLVVRPEHYADPGSAQAALRGISSVVPPRTEGEVVVFDLSFLGETPAQSRFLPPFSPEPLSTVGPEHPAMDVEKGDREFARVVPGCPTR